MDVAAHKWGADAVDEELARLIERRSRKGELDPDERCSSCSRPLWYVIRVVYDDARGGGVLS